MTPSRRARLVCVFGAGHGFRAKSCPEVRATCHAAIGAPSDAPGPDRQERGYPPPDQTGEARDLHGGEPDRGRGKRAHRCPLYPGSRGRRRSGAYRRSPASNRTFRVTPTATERRRAEGAAAHSDLEQLMLVGREKFSPLPRPVVASPRSMNAEAMLRSEWRARRTEVTIWDRAGRADLRATIKGSVHLYAAAHDQWALRATAQQQSLADAWWQSLIDGNPRCPHERVGHGVQ